MDLADIESVFPLTPMQEGMLLHTIAARDSWAGFQQLSATIEEPLAAPAFSSAWQGLVDRHAMFRTAFVWEGVASPVQVVHRKAKLEIVHQDWRAVPEPEQEARLSAYLEADKARGFQMTRAPLCRVFVARRGEGSFTFVWSYHHILLDGWSLAQSLKEVFSTYEAAKAGAPAANRAGRPFREYVLWQRRNSQAESERFWRETLAGFERPSRLVLDGGPEAQRGERDRIGEQRHHLESEAAAPLFGALRKNGLTLSTLVHGVWALLLARYGGGGDVVFATTVAGRPPELPGSDEIVGLFINNIPLRARIDDRASCIDFLRGLQKTMAATRTHEQVSMSRVQELSSVPPHQRLAESLVVVENYPIDDVLQRMGRSLKMRQVRGSVRTPYPLTFVAMAQGGGLSLHLIHSAQRFRDAAASWLLHRATEIIEQVLSDPGQPVDRVLRALPDPPANLVPEPAPMPQKRAVSQPETAIERAVVSAIEELVHPPDEIGMGTNLFELAGHSLGLVLLLHRLEARLGKKLPLSALARDPTVGRLAQLLDEGPRPWSPLVLLQPEGGRRPLFFVHPSGGEVLCYTALARALGTTRPFYGLQAAGLGTDREVTYHGVRQMASTYVEAIRRVQPTGPYFLAGWSMGGTVAFEMARQIQGAGQQVGFLGLVDSRPRESFGMAAEALRDEARLASAFLAIMATTQGTTLPEGLLADPARPVDLDEILRALEAQSLLPAGVDRSLARRYFRLWQLHLSALHEYAAEGILDNPITLFRAMEAPAPRLAQLLGLDLDPDLMVSGWRRRTRRGVAVHETPGNHYTAVYPPYAEALAAALRKSLEDAEAHCC